MSPIDRTARPPLLALALSALGLFGPIARPAAAQQANEPPYPHLGSVEVKDDRLRSLLPEGETLEILATDFEWSEGPAWMAEEGALLFSDIPRNSVFRWSERDGLRLHLRPSGYTGSAAFTGAEPGSNGLLFAPDGALVLCQHGDRRVARLKDDGTFETLAAEYRGKRLNSPNDGVFKSDGSLYFTDPPYGLPGNVDDPAKELDFQGVYRLAPDGTLTLLTKEMSRPNGIGLSPDEKTLYVANSDPERAIWMAFPVDEDGTIGEGTVLADVTDLVGKEPGLPDGLAVSRDGTIFATGPGGVLIFAPDGTHLGTIKTGEATANCTFGGEDGSTLFVTADMHLCRIPTRTKGASSGD